MESQEQDVFDDEHRRTYAVFQIVDAASAAIEIVGATNAPVRCWSSGVIDRE
jgi:hypothetical protein